MTATLETPAGTFEIAAPLFADEGDLEAPCLACGLINSDLHW